MIHGELTGWNIDVERRTIQVQGDNGQPHDAEGWVLVLRETMPPSGNMLRFAFGREVRDFVVKKLTGGVVLHGGEFPKL